MEPRPPALGSWSLGHWTTREVPLIFFFFFPWKLVDADACFTALEFATYLSAVTQAPLPLGVNRVIPILAHKENHVPLSDPGLPIYQVPLTSGVLHQLMPFSCPLITPFWRGGEEGLELGSSFIRWSSSPRWMLPGNRDWLFISISIALTPGRANQTWKRCLLRILLTLWKNKTGPKMGFEKMLEIANHLLFKEKSFSLPFYLPSFHFSSSFYSFNRCLSTRLSFSYWEYSSEPNSQCLWLWRNLIFIYGDKANKYLFFKTFFCILSIFNSWHLLVPNSQANK